MVMHLCHCACSVAMAPAVHGRHVWTASVPTNVTTGDFEYFVTLRELAYPSLGANATITVVVL